MGRNISQHLGPGNNYNGSFSNGPIRYPVQERSNKMTFSFVNFVKHRLGKTHIKRSFFYSGRTTKIGGGVKS